MGHFEGAAGAVALFGFAVIFAADAVAVAVCLGAVTPPSWAQRAGSECRITRGRGHRVVGNAQGTAAAAECPGMRRKRQQPFEAATAGCFERALSSP